MNFQNSHFSLNWMSSSLLLLKKFNIKIHIFLFTESSTANVFDESEMTRGVSKCPLLV